jgi:hypothetical protein
MTELPEIISHGADLTIVIETPEGLRANITASSTLKGELRRVTLARGFGNRAAARRFVKENGAMLADRARRWLSGQTPNIEAIQEQLRDHLRTRFGRKLRRLLLTGSRARGDWSPESDWDIVAIVEGASRCSEAGPVTRPPFHAEDGNRVDLIVIPPEDYDRPGRFLTEMRANHIDL